ncbi:MAG TPA: DUF6799 domain-containing protein [Puia sp.]|nr:DUF6799 domain-containing protein [Puia sp.]
MKKIIGLFAFTAITLCSFAQDSTKMQDTSMSKGKHMKKDCVMMKDGQVMAMKDGQKMKLEQTMTLTNGTTIAPDGTIKWPDGKTAMLKEGQSIYMDGKMGKMKDKMRKMSSDSARKY